MPLRANYSFSKVAGEAVCTWVAEHFGIPLTIIRICSTYGPLGGAPADRLDLMLRGAPIRLHPDKPNNYNPIYEDDYVELGIRAMEAARTPPLVVNWAGSETVSVEDYCTYMGELVGVEPVFEYTPDAHTSVVARCHLDARGPRPHRGPLARGDAADDRGAPPGAHPDGRTMTEGAPSDEVDAILAAGGSGVTTIFASMAARHPDGADADYLAWHTLDHRPEQYRLASLRSSVRLVSTPACRAARARHTITWTLSTT